MWRASRGGGDGLVEDATGAAVLVTRDEGADAIADGTPVLVVGCAGADGDDPRGSGYRGHARLPRVVACGVGHFVTDRSDAARARREVGAAARHRRCGAVRGAVSIAAMAAMVAWRATD